jgi:hypothetical protein
MSKMMPVHTDQDILRYVSEYDEQSFADMPDWLCVQMQVREFIFGPREPTELEQWETVADAREHRIMNNEKTLQDYKDKYFKGKSFTII